MYGYSEREFLCNNSEKMSTILDAFKQDKPSKKVWGNFRIVGNELVYTSKRQTGWAPPEFVTLTNKIALKADGLLLGNASILPLIGGYFSYGNEQENRSQTVIQALIENDSDFDFIPFNVFAEAELDLKTFAIIDKGDAETVTRNRTNPDYDNWSATHETDYKIPQFLDQTVHFLGARLFFCGGSYFLFDIDRVEIENKIFNPFLVKLPKKAKDIEDAYAILIPENVKEAKIQGLNVKRQGEWFFIPCTETPEMELSDKQKTDASFHLMISNSFGGAKERVEELLGEKEFKRLENLELPIPMPITLKAGRNRPNAAQYGIKKDHRTFVKGTISHTGREHKDLELMAWHEAVCNTAMDSFTILGDVD